MSTGNNQDDTLVTKRRKRRLSGYIHPNLPEIKKFDFFTGGYADTGSFRIINAREFSSTLNPVGGALNTYGSWHLVKMGDPSQGTSSYERIGVKYFLKYIKFKGHISINLVLPFTIRYKLLLIKSDTAFTDTADFFGKCMSNYQPYSSIVDTFSEIEEYCRHNFYKTYKWASGMAEHRCSVMVVHSGTLSPPDYVYKPTKSSTLGSQPSWTYTLPDILRFANGAQVNAELNQMCYLPLNVSVQVNDNVTVGSTHFYLLLCTDHGIGVAWPTTSGSTQLLYRASDNFASSCVRFNFFGVSYFTDL